MELNYQIRTLFDRRKKASATVKGSVEIEIYFNRQRVRMATGVMVLKQQWKLGHVVNHPDAEALNRRIQEMRTMLDERMKTMARQGYIDIETLKSDKVAQTAKVSSGSFIEWLHERIMKRPVAESTRKQHLVMFEDLKKFGKIINFSDLTTRNIMLWNDQLQERLNTQSSVHGYHKRLKPYITEALQFELIKENPYDHIRIKRGKSTTIKFLSVDERTRIEELELFGPTEKARDMFIFSCYTGLSHADLIKIKKEDVKKDGEDYIINDFRQKTGSEYNIMLLPPAMKILRKYNFNLNLMSNQKCNDQLKLIAQMAGIHINLTMHVGRHTFATWALTEGVDIATVSKMLAHANVSTTEIYAKVLQRKVTSGFSYLKTRLGP